MGLKISSQDAFERAMKRNERINRSNEFSKHREPTLAEQIARLEKLEDERRIKRAQEKTEAEKPRFSPLYDAKYKSEQNKKKK
jgi:hypothetical protein